MTPSEAIYRTLELARAIPRPPRTRGKRPSRAPLGPQRRALMDFLLTQPAAVLYSIAVLYCVSPHERDFDFWTCYFAIGDANRNLPRGILELTSDPDFADHVERGWRRLAAGGIDLDAALTGGDPWGR